MGEIVIPKLPEDWVDPGAQGHFDAAMAAIQKEDYQAAIGSLETVVGLAPGFPEVYYNLAFALEKLGNTEKAIEHYKKALETRPDYYAALLAMGEIYTNRQEWPQAAEYLKKASDARPSEVAVRYNYGAVMMNLGDTPAAYAAFEKVLELDPSRALAHYQLGMISVSEANNEQAIAHLENYLDSNRTALKRTPPAASWSFSRNSDPREHRPLDAVSCLAGF